MTVRQLILGIIYLVLIIIFALLFCIKYYENSLPATDTIKNSVNNIK